MNFKKGVNLFSVFFIFKIIGGASTCVGTMFNAVGFVVGGVFNGAGEIFHCLGDMCMGG